MPILVTKIIHIRDYGSHYNRLEFEFSNPRNIEYGSGVFQKIIPDDARLKFDVDLDLTFPLFNKAKNAKIIENIGAYGLLYLELQPKKILNEIYVEPDDIVSDILYGTDTLIYSFYNSGSNSAISLTISTAEDTHNAYSKIKAHSTDLEWRQYFIKQALIKPGVKSIQVADPVIRELMTVEQVADYLQVKKKTIQNWTSKGDIPCHHIGGSVRYKKSELEKWINKK